MNDFELTVPDLYCEIGKMWLCGSQSDSIVSKTRSGNTGYHCTYSYVQLCFETYPLFFAFYPHGYDKEGLQTKVKSKSSPSIVPILAWGIISTE